MHAGERLAIFVGPVPEDKLPKDATPGRVLTGRLVVAKLAKSAGGGDAPGGLPFTFTCAPAWVCMLPALLCLLLRTSPASGTRLHPSPAGAKLALSHHAMSAGHTLADTFARKHHAEAQESAVATQAHFILSLTAAALSFFCSVPPKAETPKSPIDADPPPPPKTPQERLDETLRSAQVKFLEGLKSDDSAEADLYSSLQHSLLSQHPKHEPLLLERLRRLDGEKRKEHLQVGHSVAVWFCRKAGGTGVWECCF